MQKLYLLGLLIISVCLANTSFAQLTVKKGCEVNGINYQQALAFKAELQHALQADDKIKLALMMDYPVRVNRLAHNGKRVPSYLKTKKDFAKQYGSIFNKPTQDALLKAELFCNAQGASLDGFVWFTTSKEGVKIFAINPVE